MIGHKQICRSSRIILIGSILLCCLSFTVSGETLRAAHSYKIAGVNGTTLSYEMKGRGPTLVLIHGGLVDSRVWDDQFSYFAKFYRVIRYDLRGFSKSASPEGPFSHVEDLYALLKFLKIERASLVGLSLGGMVATDFTLEHPEMVEKLILVSSGLRGYQGVRNEKAAAIYKAAETEGKEKAIAMWLEHPFFATGKQNKSYRQRVRRMLEDNFKYWGPTPQPIDLKWPAEPSSERLSAIKSPTLIIIGDKDFSNILNIADKLNSEISGSRKVVIQEVSHHLNMEKPVQFNKVVLDFLRR